MDLTLLMTAFPAFTITCYPHGWREPRWEAVRRNPADPGLYAVITPDLAELHAILATTELAAPEPSTRPHAPGPVK
jgi:hypothetical protein